MGYTVKAVPHVHDQGVDYEVIREEEVVATFDNQKQAELYRTVLSPVVPPKDPELLTDNEVAAQPAEDTGPGA